MVLHDDFDDGLFACKSRGDCVDDGGMQFSPQAGSKTASGSPSKVEVAASLSFMSGSALSWASKNTRLPPLMGTIPCAAIIRAGVGALGSREFADLFGQSLNGQR